MQINPSLSPSENMLALINESNPGLNLSLSKVTVGSPVTYAGQNGINSQVVVTAIANKGFSGSETIYYRRLTLDEGVADNLPPVRFETGDSVATIMARACSARGILPSEVDQANPGSYVEPTPTSPLSKIQLVPKSGSLVYTGSAVFDVEIMLPEVTMGVLTNFLSSTTGWQNDATRGWYNNDTDGLEIEHATIFTADQLKYLKKISGVFTSYYNTPAGCIGNSGLKAKYTDASNNVIGIWDAWASEVNGHVVYEGFVSSTKIFTDIVDQYLEYDIPTNKVPNAVILNSARYSTYQPTNRGMKNLKLTFNTVG